MTLAHVDRASVLVDGAAYFTAFRLACEQARSRILIVGWYLDFYTLRHPGVLGEFLRGLVDKNRNLQVHRWDEPAHTPDDPERVFHAGDPYAPFHDKRQHSDLVTRRAARRVAVVKKEIRRGCRDTTAACDEAFSS